MKSQMGVVMNIVLGIKGAAVAGWLFGFGPQSRLYLYGRTLRPTPLGDAPSQQSRRERKAAYSPATPDSR